jgi:hypothetical protein
MNAWLVPRIERLDWSIINIDGAETPLSGQVSRALLDRYINTLGDLARRKGCMAHWTDVVERSSSSTHGLGICTELYSPHSVTGDIRQP